MPLATEIFGDVIILHTPDELGVDQSDSFESHATSLDRKNVVLDMDKTDSIDSKGLASILNVQDRLRDQGGELKISITGPTNRKILEITRLDQQIEVFDSVVDAVKSFQ